MKEQKTTLHNAFLDHVAEVGEYVKRDFSTVRPLIWDETVNKIDAEAILSHKFADFLDIVINTVQDVTKLGELSTFHFELRVLYKFLKIVYRRSKTAETDTAPWKSFRKCLACDPLQVRCSKRTTSRCQTVH